MAKDEILTLNEADKIFKHVTGNSGELSFYKTN